MPHLLRVGSHAHFFFPMEKETVLSNSGQAKFYRSNMGVFVSQAEIGIGQGKTTGSRYHCGFETFLWNVWIGLGCGQEGVMRALGVTGEKALA